MGEVTPQRRVTASRLVLAGGPGIELRTISRLLQNAGVGSDGVVGNSPDLVLREACSGGHLRDLAKEIGDDPDSGLLLAYQDPVSLIAEAISQGASPADSLTSWQADTGPLLAAFRRVRRRTVLFELSAALAEPAELVSQLGQRFGLSLYRQVEKPDISNAANPDLVYMLMAESVLRHDFRSRKMLSELDASALPFVNRQQSASIDVSKAALIYREKTKSLNGDLSALRREKKTLLSQLQQAQDELQERGNKNNQLRVEIDALEKELAEINNENKLLLRQTHHVQSELEQYFLDNQNLEVGAYEAEKMRKRIGELERRIRYFENSKSWKITAPLRALLKFFKYSPSQNK